jgi:hypothetical protein
MPMRGELPPIAARPYSRVARNEAERSWLIAVISSPDVQSVVAFCTIGLLATINAVLYFPGFGEMFTQLAIFP